MLRTINIPHFYLVAKFMWLLQHIFYCCLSYLVHLFIPSRLFKKSHIVGSIMCVINIKCEINSTGTFNNTNVSTLNWRWLCVQSLTFVDIIFDFQYTSGNRHHNQVYKKSKEIIRWKKMILENQYLSTDWLFHVFLNAPCAKEDDLN